jgi:hypothetical protein
VQHIDFKYFIFNSPFKSKQMRQLAKLAFAAMASTALMVACKKGFESSPENGIQPVSAGTSDARPDSTISGVITSDLFLSNTKEYFLQGLVYVAQGANLTIEKGSLIRGNAGVDQNNPGGGLVITRGSKIFADGTAAEPIVFTSAKPAGMRCPGDWSGIVILGNGRTNQGTEVGIEGIEGTPPASAKYGGNDNDDNSGILRYVRIEYAGFRLKPNNEINGLTFGAVGRGTVVDYVQVSYSNDDAFEFFGGAVNCKHLFAYHYRDDGFDFDFGYSGKIQYGFAKVSDEIKDQSGSNGIECDNNNNAGGAFCVSPYTRPVLSNITLVGRSTRADAASQVTYPIGCFTLASGEGTTGRMDFGAHFRRGTRALLCNSLMQGWVQGLNLDGSGSYGTANESCAIPFSHKDNTLRPDRARIRHNVFQAYDSAVVVKNWNPLVYSSVNAQAKFVSDKGRVYTTTNPNDSIGLRDPYAPLVARWYQLRNDSRNLDGATFSGADLKDPFFDQVIFKGAFDFKSSGDWAAGWTNFNPQNTAY